MKIQIDSKKANKLAKILYKSFLTTGILGQTEMPEDILPKGIERGSLEHILFITLTVSIDYMRDANLLWNSSRKTFEDHKTKYLFEPEFLAQTSYEKIINDMQKYGLAKRPKNDSYIWKTVGTSFQNKWDGNPLNFLNHANWNSIEILNNLKKHYHILNDTKKTDFPYLRGPKIGPLWIRMLKDNAGITKINDLDKVPIPIDIHIARASLATGVVYGEFEGRLDHLFEFIREAWFEGVKDLQIDNRIMIALDVDEALWHLSKYGCTNRDKYTGKCPVYDHCEVKKFCINGKISITNGNVSLNTGIRS